MKHLKAADRGAGVKSTSQLLAYHKHAVLQSRTHRSKSPNVKKDKPLPFNFENELNGK